MRLTENQIDELTAFEHGDEFANEAEVREYFTVAAQVAMFSRDPDYVAPTQAELDEMADAVIANRWHMAAAPVAYEVRMSDRVENTGLDCQRFAARDEAQQAADAVNADHPGAKAEVIEVAGEPTTTFAAWNES